MNASFLNRYTQTVTAAIPADYSDNYDADRFGPKRASFRTFTRRLRGLLTKCAGVLVKQADGTVTSGMNFVTPHLTELEWLHSRLADEESREILVKTIAFRALGNRKIKLPLNCPEHWELIARMKKEAEGRESIDPGFMGFRLCKMDLRGIGYPIELFFFPYAIVTQFIEQQYRCVTAQGNIEAVAGDAVIDAGGCYGDTALYFAHKTGAEGKVVSFEFLPDNLKIYQRNLELNPGLAKRIRLLPNPVWSAGDEELFVSGHGPGTTVGPIRKTADSQMVRTLSIDQIFERGDLERVNFIKMDIEGAELSALRGAEKTLRRFRPKLAICVYHSLADFWEIPKYLESLNLGYKFYLRHFSIHQEETVLFAAVL